MTGNQAAAADRPDQIPAGTGDVDQDSRSAGDAATGTVLVEDLLVEEVSIDGMCGVY